MAGEIAWQTRDTLPSSFNSSCYFHHPDVACQPEQLRESLHLPSVQWSGSQEAGVAPVQEAFRRKGLSARGGDAGQHFVSKLKKSPRVKVKIAHY